MKREKKLTCLLLPRGLILLIKPLHLFIHLDFIHKSRQQTKCSLPRSNPMAFIQKKGAY